MSDNNEYSLGEKFNFHPLVRHWLEANGYTYDYEVKMPEYGRADFVAKHPEGYTLIVECKVNKAATSPNSIDQLLNYQRQLPLSRAAYAIPADLVTETISNLCHEHDILLVPILIPDELKVPSPIKERKSPPRASNHRPQQPHDTERLFLSLYRDFQKRSLVKLQERGHLGLQVAHSLAIFFFDIEGTRIVTLAERAGMTKQSMGDLIRELEAQGYVERAEDKTDKRAFIVKFTERGTQFLRDAYDIKQEIEAEYAAMIGDESFALVKSALIQILEQSPTDLIR